MISLIAPRFKRRETLANSEAFVLGVISDLGRKNCWTLAERSGHDTPDRLQYLLSRATWDTNGEERR